MTMNGFDAKTLLAVIVEREVQQPESGLTLEQACNGTFHTD